MKILYHHRTQAKGAEGVHIREIVKALEGAGNKVFIVSPPGIDIFKDSFDSHNSGKSSMLSNFWSAISKFMPQIFFELMEIAYNLSALYNINNIIKKEKIDFIYERNAFFCFAGSYLAQKHDIPIIIEVNEISGIKRVRGQVLKGLAKKIEKENFLKSSALIVVSSFLKQQIRSFGVEEKNVYVIPNGVNLDEFDPGIKKDDVIVNKLGLNNKTVLGFVGGFVAWHNFEFLIESFRTIIDLDPREEIVLMLVGDGPKKAEIVELVSIAGLKERVLFIGSIGHKDISKYIQLMDICLIPHSNEYRSPIKLFEYMSMAKPVVAPRLEPIESVIADDYDGKLFDLNDRKSFAQAVLSLIKDRIKRESISAKAREKILSKYLWKNNANAVIGIYNKLNKNV
jgi:glycosyltransferase involved in cell wall biosynthesis